MQIVTKRYAKEFIVALFTIANKQKQDKNRLWHIIQWNTVLYSAEETTKNSGYHYRWDND